MSYNSNIIGRKNDLQNLELFETKYCKANCINMQNTHLRKQMRGIDLQISFDFFQSLLFYLLSIHGSRNM